MAWQSLKKRGNKLAETTKQIALLESGIFFDGSLPRFAAKLNEHSIKPIEPRTLEIFQVNIGYMCNQVCKHCHVDAGPDRKEKMSLSVLNQCIDTIKLTGAKTLDITGGAPEMHPKFRWFVERAAGSNLHDIIVRSNLTIILANKKYNDLPDFFKSNKIHIISSLPYYRKSKTDNQRGSGVFETSIKALEALNEVGYGQDDTTLKLDLVYNPAGAFLPGDQAELEKEFKHELEKNYGVVFNNLFTITNMPVSRFLDYLVASENYQEYMQQLINAFNPSAVENVMCRNTLSVRWDGKLFDCDFNQMLDLELNCSVKYLSDFNQNIINNRLVNISQHCYGCTAGSGSSCQGSVV